MSCYRVFSRELVGWCLLLIKWQQPTYTTRLGRLINSLNKAKEEAVSASQVQILFQDLVFPSTILRGWDGRHTSVCQKLKNCQIQYLSILATLPFPPPPLCSLYRTLSTFNTQRRTMLAQSTKIIHPSFQRSRKSCGFLIPGSHNAPNAMQISTHMISSHGTPSHLEKKLISV